MKRTRILQGLAIASWLVGVTGHAAQAEDEMPDDAFLEFLGGWESVEGEWIDPTALADLEAEGKLADSGIKSAEDVDEDDENES